MAIHGSKGNQGMASTLAALPIEVSENIASTVDPEDIASLRLVCRALGIQLTDIFGRRCLSTICTNLSPSSLKRLEALGNCDKYRLWPRTLRLQGTAEKDPYHGDELVWLQYQDDHVVDPLSSIVKGTLNQHLFSKLENCRSIEMVAFAYENEDQIIDSTYEKYSVLNLASEVDDAIVNFAFENLDPCSSNRRKVPDVKIAEALGLMLRTAVSTKLWLHSPEISSSNSRMRDYNLGRLRIQESETQVVTRSGIEKSRVNRTLTLQLWHPFIATEETGKSGQRRIEWPDDGEMMVKKQRYWLPPRCGHARSRQPHESFTGLTKLDEDSARDPKPLDLDLVLYAPSHVEPKFPNSLPFTSPEMGVLSKLMINCKKLQSVVPDGLDSHLWQLEHWPTITVYNRYTNKNVIHDKGMMFGCMAVDGKKVTVGTSYRYPETDWLSETLEDPAGLSDDFHWTEDDAVPSFS